MTLPIDSISSTLKSPAVQSLLKAKQSNLSTQKDSIGSSIAFEPPVLTPPGSIPKLAKKELRSDLRLLKTTAQSQQLGSEILDSLSLRFADFKEKIREISAEMLQKLKEVAQKAKSSNFWGILKKIATCLLSAASASSLVWLWLPLGGGALIGAAPDRLLEFCL